MTTVPNPAVRKFYNHYVSQGHADSDGYYAPVSFESWVYDARTEIHPFLDAIADGETLDSTLARWREASKWDRPVQGLGELVLRTAAAPLEAARTLDGIAASATTREP